VTGSVVGQNVGHDAAQGAQQIGNLLSSPADLTEAAVQMFGSDEQRASTTKTANSSGQPAFNPRSWHPKLGQQHHRIRTPRHRANH
jgi:hypothetical protein